MKKNRFRTLPFLISGIFLLTGISGQAQLVSPRSSNIQFDNLLSRGSVINPIYYENIDGSPYLNQEFMPGDLSMKNGMIYENIGFRYNIYTDQIEFKQDKEILSFSQPQDLDRVKFGNATFVYGRMFSKNKPIQGYFQLLADGYARLLVRRSLEIKSEKLPASEFGGGNYRDYFRLAEDYFISKDGKNLVPIRKSEKSILKALGEKQGELKQFLSESSLNLKNDIDLGELVFYFNQLMKED